MLILGIESTAHTVGVGIVKNGKIVANESAMYRPAPGSGIIPADAAKFHKEHIDAVMQAALGKASVALDDLDAVAVASGPGLPLSLLVGVDKARELLKAYGLPIIPVNHCVAHIEIGKLNKKLKDPLVVYTSGANTQVLGLADHYYRILGETLDIGIGNAIDVFGREVGIGTPAGMELERLALLGKKYVELPYSVKGMDLVFSGIVTAATRLKNSETKEDLCYSFQETIFSMLCEVTERALAHMKKKEILFVGGVAQNKRLQQMMQLMAKPHGATFSVPDREFLGDNGGMIAFTGWLARKHATMDVREIDINPRWRTDEVYIDW